MTNQEQFTALYKEISKRHPKFSIKRKETSTFMKFLFEISLMRLWNKNFMTNYITTIGNTIYWPMDRRDESPVGSSQSDFDVLAHEYMHIFDRQRLGTLVYTLSYLFPQWLALLSLGAIGAIWTPWCYLFLLCLLFLAPWPASGRRDIELRGYGMDLAVKEWRSGVMGTEEFYNFSTEQFTGWSYYRMSWSPKYIDYKLMQYTLLAHLGMLTEEPFVVVRGIIKANK